MKKCSECNELQNLSEFYKTKKNKDGLFNVCKSCEKIKDRNRYLKNKEKIYLNNLKKRKFLAEEVNKLKNDPCKDCCKIYEPFLMDFDHIKDNKIMPISKMIHETFSLENIKKEINKCELVCALCHRDRTQKRALWNKSKTNWNCIARNKAIIKKAKEIPCTICNNTYNYWQMDFDHVYGEKITEISTLKAASQAKLEAEIKKCQVLCVICHRKKTKETLWDK